MSCSAKHERLAISRPTEGAAGQTGSWRVFRPVVNKEKCNACGLCSLYCPDNAIDEELVVDFRVLQRLWHL